MTVEYYINVKMRRIFRISFILVTWTTLLSCDGVSAIINGKNVTIENHHQFPYLVSFANSTIHHWCGGSIISDEFVLTAAHCVMKDNETFYDLPRLIVGGVHALNTDEESKVVVEVEKMFVDKRYNHLMWADNIVPEYDWALLKLKTKLDIKNNPNLSIIQLPKKIPGTDDYPTYENVIAQFAGFGYDYVRLVIKNETGFVISKDETDYDPDSVIENNYIITDTGNSTGMLHWVNVRILNSKECHIKYKNNSALLDSRFCAAIVPNSNVPHGPCSGDSGSPLVYENMVIGLLSSSILGCNENNAPSAYTKVAPLVETITSVMKGITNGMLISSTPEGEYWDN